ncbi:MAG: hypothetical protein KGS61_21225 [Verrucomicrobia bacterium]|nr:hypothetical protein [Verrucomicrobiota bacterium]
MPSATGYWPGFGAVRGLTSRGAREQELSGGGMALFSRKRNKDEHRYYLLPGMGRSNRRRRQEIFRWSIVVGLVAAAVFGLLLYYLNRF